MLTRARVAVARSVVRWREWLWWRTKAGHLTRQRLRALRGRYTGRRCFILGNGPSLRRTDVRLVRDEVTIGSNGIFLLFPEVGFRTTFVTVEDRVFAEDRAHELNALHGTMKLFPHDLAYCITADDDSRLAHRLDQWSRRPPMRVTFIPDTSALGIVLTLRCWNAWRCHTGRRRRSWKSEV